jgi:RNA polymerase-binding protein DksA
MTVLNERQKARLQRLLRDRAAQLRSEIEDELARAGNEHFADLAGSVTDTADEAAADVLTDIENAAVARHAAELRDIDAALARIDAGGYGRCADCGADIDYERLLAQPTATRCQRCQQRHETLYANSGAPPR